MYTDMFMIVALFVYGKSEQINEYKYKCMLKKVYLLCHEISLLIQEFHTS